MDNVFEVYRIHPHARKREQARKSCARIPTIASFWVSIDTIIRLHYNIIRYVLKNIPFQMESIVHSKWNNPLYIADTALAHALHASMTPDTGNLLENEVTP